jgi:hypothetical protein
MKMKLLFAINVGTEVALPAGVTFGRYEVALLNTLTPKEVPIVSSDKTPTVEFAAVEEGTYTVKITAHDDKGNILGTPVKDTLIVTNSPGTAPGYYQPPLGYSVIMAPAVVAL